MCHSTLPVLLFFFLTLLPPVSYLSTIESLSPTISAAFAVKLQSIFVPVPAVQLAPPFRHLHSLFLLYFWLSSYTSPNLNWLPQPWALFQNCLFKCILHLPPCKGFCMFLPDMNWLNTIDCFLHFHSASVPFLLPHFFFYPVTHRKISHPVSFSNPSTCPVTLVLLKWISLPLTRSFSVFRNKDCYVCTAYSTISMIRCHYSYENNISKFLALFRREIFFFFLWNREKLDLITI